MAENAQAFLKPCSPLQIPPEFDVDAESCEDCFVCPEYAKEIFDYLKQREVSRGPLRGATALILGRSQRCRLAGEVCPARLHAHAAEPQRGDAGHPGGLAGGGAGQ